jgi:hypothetical protein
VTLARSCPPRPREPGLGNHARESGQWVVWSGVAGDLRRVWSTSRDVFETLMAC